MPKALRKDSICVIVSWMARLSSTTILTRCHDDRWSPNRTDEYCSGCRNRTTKQDHYQPTFKELQSKQRDNEWDPTDQEKEAVKKEVKPGKFQIMLEEVKTELAELKVAWNTSPTSIPPYWKSNQSREDKETEELARDVLKMTAQTVTTV